MLCKHKICLPCCFLKFLVVVKDIALLQQTAAGQLPALPENISKDGIHNSPPSHPNLITDVYYTQPI